MNRLLFPAERTQTPASVIHNELDTCRSVRHQVLFCLFVTLVIGTQFITLNGCATKGGMGWARRPPCALEPDASKEEVLACINRNVIHSESHPALASWRCGSVRLKVDGVPVALPAQIAIEAPSNFRLLVSNPLSGGQEVDIGSNAERFWIWSKDQPQILTASHEDVSLALQELEMPVHIHPVWLMEVFGVVRLNAADFEMRPSRLENGTVDLVSRSESPLGEDVERVVRVNLCRGCVQEHLLRLPGGKVIARARLDRYTQLPCGNRLPLSIKLEWPDAQMAMTMEIRDPETNARSLAGNKTIFKMPNNGPVVDIGMLARQKSGHVKGDPLMSTVPAALKSPGKVQLTGNEETNWADDSPARKERITGRPTGLPEITAQEADWARK